MLNVVVVEDQGFQRKTLIRHLKKVPQVNTIIEASSADELYEIVIKDYDKAINCLIIDVDLGEDSENGLDAYSVLVSEGYDIPAILITGSTFHASYCYQAGVIDVIEKTILFNHKRLVEALRKINTYYQFKKFHENNGVVVPITGEVNTVLYPSDLIYLEAMGGLVKIVTESSEEYFSSIKLAFYEELLKKSGYLSVHRSYLINVCKVEKICDSEVILKNGIAVPVSRDRVKQLNDIMNPTVLRKLINFI